MKGKRAHPLYNKKLHVQKEQDMCRKLIYFCKQSWKKQKQNDRTIGLKCYNAM